MGAGCTRATVPYIVVSSYTYHAVARTIVAPSANNTKNVSSTSSKAHVGLCYWGRGGPPSLKTLRRSSSARGTIAYRGTSGDSNNITVPWGRAAATTKKSCNKRRYKLAQKGGAHNSTPQCQQLWCANLVRPFGHHLTTHVSFRCTGPWASASLQRTSFAVGPAHYWHHCCHMREECVQDGSSVKLANVGTRLLSGCGGRRG
jgi:hypothetical protein